ncbi:hypothetical protein O181_042268 [Austropuccinia psidii MF-1]|uniref:Uncharacterized protein n=1 Tax=Austropuccinia psidii MF-1 TaxID=1389203 RepID=A0A9Q3HEL9_9BASI|nr:hypothetical protein [Austropuccinia psidii MF-1]
MSDWKPMRQGMTQASWSFYPQRLAVAASSCLPLSSLYEHLEPFSSQQFSFLPQRAEASKAHRLASGTKSIARGKLHKKRAWRL